MVAISKQRVNDLLLSVERFSGYHPYSQTLVAPDLSICLLICLRFVKTYFRIFACEVILVYG